MVWCISHFLELNLFYFFQEDEKLNSSYFHKADKNWTFIFFSRAYQNSFCINLSEYSHSLSFSGQGIGIGEDIVLTTGSPHYLIKKTWNVWNCYQTLSTWIN